MKSLISGLPHAWRYRSLLWGSFSLACPGVAWGQANPSATAPSGPSASRFEVHAANGGTAIGQINGAVTIYANCSATVNAGSPKIVLAPACDPAVRDTLNRQIKEIAALENKPAASLDATQIAHLLSSVRAQYRSARVAAIELEASRKTVQVATQSLAMAQSLVHTDQAYESTSAAMRAEVLFAQANFREKSAAYRFALTNDPLDELEIYRARVLRASVIAKRSKEVSEEAGERFRSGNEALLTMTTSRLEQVRNQEALAAACGAMEDQLTFVRTIAPASRTKSKKVTPQDTASQSECTNFGEPAK